MLGIVASCTTHYHVSDISRSRILVDSRYDNMVDNDVQAFMAPYKHKVDSIMSPKLGRVAKNMSAHKPESEQSNLLADILVWAGDKYNEKPDIGLYNMGGIRADLIKGDVTYGDVLDMAPFENKICFLTLSGEKLLTLFRQIASVGGEAVSHGVELKITKDRKLVDAKINGKEIDRNASYRIATIDYLSQGNDKLEVLREGTDVNSPKDAQSNTRFIIMDYFREMDKQGKVVDAQIEGRVKVVE